MKKKMKIIHYIIYVIKYILIINNEEYELLIRFSKKNDIVFNLGAPFLNNWVTAYDY